MNRISWYKNNFSAIFIFNNRTSFLNKKGETSFKYASPFFILFNKYSKVLSFPDSKQTWQNWLNQNILSPIF